MANKEHVKILSRGVHSWNQWRNIDNAIPDLSGITMYGFNFKSLSILSPHYFEEFENNRTFFWKRRRFTSNSKREYLPDLFRIDLSGANFQDTNFQDSIFFEAGFINADFTDANLENTQLPSSRLMGAKFINTNLRNANLDNAHLRDTVFANTMFENTSGLESCIHSGPSTIDRNSISTLRGFYQKFLRGCGLSDWELEFSKLYNEHLTEQDISKYTRAIMDLRGKNTIKYFSCFISYSHSDKEFAKKLFNSLQNIGINCWLDEHQMLPGDDIYEQVDKGVNLWDKVLLCCSMDALTSWWVDNEIDTAFEKERLFMNKEGAKVLSLIPLNLDDYMFSSEWKSGKKRQIKSRLAADFTNWENDDDKFTIQIEKLILSLRADSSARTEPPESRL